MLKNERQSSKKYMEDIKRELQRLGSRSELSSGAYGPKATIGFFMTLFCNFCENFLFEHLTSANIIVHKLQSKQPIDYLERFL